MHLKPVCEVLPKHAKSEAASLSSTSKRTMRGDMRQVAELHCNKGIIERSAQSSTQASWTSTEAGRRLCFQHANNVTESESNLSLQSQKKRTTSSITEQTNKNKASHRWNKTLRKWLQSGIRHPCGCETRGPFRFRAACEAGSVRLEVCHSIAAQHRLAAPFANEQTTNDSQTTELTTTTELITTWGKEEPGHPD